MLSLHTSSSSFKLYQILFFLSRSLYFHIIIPHEILICKSQVKKCFFFKTILNNVAKLQSIKETRMELKEISIATFISIYFPFFFLIIYTYNMPYNPLPFSIPFKIIMRVRLFHFKRPILTFSFPFFFSL